MPALEPSFDFFAGKGGVGKTTCSALFALSQVRLGHPTLLVSTDPAHSLGDALALPLGPTPKPVRGVRGLWAMELDAERALSRWFDGRREAMADAVRRGTYLDEADVDRLLELTLPGADDLICLIELRRLGALGRWARVVVDTAPTGHTLRLMSSPEVLRGLGEILSEMDSKHRFLVSALGGRPGIDSTGDLIEELIEEARQLRQLLRRRGRTAVHWVLTPEPLVVAETVRGVRQLARMGIAVSELVANRSRGDAPPQSCTSCRTRARVERAAMAAVGRALPQLEVRAVPAFGVEPIGVGALERGLTHQASPSGASHRRSRAALAPDPGLPGDRPDLGGVRLALVGGKGGVGKTTIASALALEEAGSRRVMLLSTDPAPSLSDAFGQRIGHRGARVAKNLWVRELDAQRSLAQRKARIRGGVEELFEAVHQRNIELQFDRAALMELVELAPPGMDEVMSLLEVARVTAAARPRFDLVVVDTAPTGHTLRLLSMPQTILGWVHALLEVLLKYRKVVRLSGVAEDLLELARDLKGLEALLHDRRRCSFLTVARPGLLPLRESRRLMRALRQQRIHRAGLVINGVTGSRCGWCQAGGQNQEECRKELVRLAGEHSAPTFHAPWTMPPPHGKRGLARWLGQWARAEAPRTRGAPV